VPSRQSLSMVQTPKRNTKQTSPAQIFQTHKTHIQQRKRLTYRTCSSVHTSFKNKSFHVPTLQISTQNSLQNMNQSWEIGTEATLQNESFHSTNLTKSVRHIVTQCVHRNRFSVGSNWKASARRSTQASWLLQCLWEDLHMHLVCLSLSSWFCVRKRMAKSRFKAQLGAKRAVSGRQTSSV